MLFKKKIKFTHTVLENNSMMILQDGKCVLPIPAEIVNQSISEMKNWYKYLNTTLGVPSFLFALAVQGTPNPPLNAAFCLIWVLLAHIYAGSPYPDSLKRLKKSNKKACKYYVKLLEKEHLSTLKLIIRVPLFLLGYLYLLIMVLLNFPEVRNLMIFDHTIAEYFLNKECLFLIKA